MRSAGLGSSIHSGIAITQPGDIAEREADRMAERALHLPADFSYQQAEPRSAGSVHVVKTSLKTLPQGSSAANLDLWRGSGQPLAPAIRQAMEPRFGFNFKEVRIHADERAAESARQVNAVAFTIGRDILFDRGGYAPDTPGGQRLLAHELAHVTQASGSGFPIVRRQTRSPASPRRPARLRHNSGRRGPRIFRAVVRGSAGVLITS